MFCDRIEEYYVMMLNRDSQVILFIVIMYCVHVSMLVYVCRCICIAILQTPKILLILPIKLLLDQLIGVDSDYLVRITVASLFEQMHRFLGF